MNLESNGNVTGQAGMERDLRDFRDWLFNCKNEMSYDFLKFTNDFGGGSGCRGA
jgi:hypothetical protein